MDDIYILENAIWTGCTNTIQLNYVNLLYESSGTEKEALKPGWGDLSPLSTPLTMKTHIENDFMKLSLDSYLLRITTVALLKLITFLHG